MGKRGKQDTTKKAYKVRNRHKENQEAYAKFKNNKHSKNLSKLLRKHHPNSEVLRKHHPNSEVRVRGHKLEYSILDHIFKKFILMLCTFQNVVD